MPSGSFDSRPALAATLVVAVTGGLLAVLALTLDRAGVATPAGSVGLEEGVGGFSTSTPRITPVPWRPTGELPICEDAAGASPSPGASAGPTPSQATTAAPPAAPAVAQVREIDTQDTRVGRPAGLTYAESARVLLILGQPPKSGSADTVAGIVTLFGDPAGPADLALRVPDPGNVAFDAAGRRLLALDPANALLIQTEATSEGQLRRGAEAIDYNVSALGLTGAAGMSVDPATGTTYVLDPPGSRILRIKADQRSGGPSVPALRDGGVCTIGLAALGEAGFPIAELKGLAFDPTDGVLHVGAGGRLVALDWLGTVRIVRDLAAVGVGQAVGLVFAPSGDPTDDPAVQHLYVVDRVERAGAAVGNRDRLVELAFTEGRATGPPPTADVHGVLVRTIDTSAWSPPSPDPSGLAWKPDVGRLLATDAEVDEHQLFRGANVFEATADGSLASTAVTAFSREPSGAAVDQQGGRLMFSDDHRRRVFVVELGGDGAFGTRDDRVSTFNTTTFGCYDPEGVAFGEGSLFIADGLGAEIFRVTPGPDGVFDGGPPTGDDLVTQFDTAALGQPNPEGIEFDPIAGTLLVVSNDARANLLEATTAGEIVRIVDLSFLNAIAPAGLAIESGEETAESTRNVFIADRGVDNDEDPAENDGRVFEIAIRDGPPPNLVANPGMELDDDRDGTVDGWDANPHVTRSPDRARGGDHSMRISGDVAPYAVAQRVPSVTGGRPYTLSLWVNVPLGDRPFMFRVRLRWRDGAGNNLGTVRVATITGSTPGWDKIVATIPAPDLATEASIVLSIEGPSATVYVDDVLVQP